MSINQPFLKLFLPIAMTAGMTFWLPAQAAPDQRSKLIGNSIFELAGDAAGSGNEQLMKVAQAERRVRRKRRKVRRSRSRTRKRSTGSAASAASKGPASQIPGRYAILRTKNKDAGCLLSLNRSGRAQVGPGCQDHGVQIFDPVRWSLRSGQIVLQARKGHRISFSRKTDGTWQRSPAGKKSLGMRKY